eukprot:5162970-Pyramimonas_sp.AAC.1
MTGAELSATQEAWLSIGALKLQRARFAELLSWRAGGCGQTSLLQMIGGLKLSVLRPGIPRTHSVASVGESLPSAPLSD